MDCQMSPDKALLHSRKYRGKTNKQTQSPPEAPRVYGKYTEKENGNTDPQFQRKQIYLRNKWPTE